jgi:hypothetical protein
LSVDLLRPQIPAHVALNQKEETAPTSLPKPMQLEGGTSRSSAQTRNKRHRGKTKSEILEFYAVGRGYIHNCLSQNLHRVVTGQNIQKNENAKLY